MFYKTRVCSLRDGSVAAQNDYSSQQARAENARTSLKQEGRELVIYVNINYDVDRSSIRNYRLYSQKQRGR